MFLRIPALRLHPRYHPGNDCPIGQPVIVPWMNNNINIKKLYIIISPGVYTSRDC